MNIVGISGKAGSGKGEAARVLVQQFGFARVSFADEIKRTVRRWWPNFTIEDLWGPSEARSRAHPEYGGLTARRACQFIGTEVGRALDADVWVRFGMNVARLLLEGGCWYSAPEGFVYTASARKPHGVAFDDLRFPNELEAIKAAGGKSALVVRPGAGLQGEAAEHASEHALDDESVKFDAMLVNAGSLDEFRSNVSGIAQHCFGLKPI